MAKKKPAISPRAAKRAAEEAETTRTLVEGLKTMASLAQQALVSVKQIGIADRPVDSLVVSELQLLVLRSIPELTTLADSKLASTRRQFTFAEVAHMVTALTKVDLSDPMTKMASLQPVLLAAELLQGLHVGLKLLELKTSSGVTLNPAKADPNAVYQFKITLLGTKPPIWRRIQMSDCTLDELHGHIQDAMGWSDTHLYQFEMNGQLFSDPESMEDAFDEFNTANSVSTKISQVVRPEGERTKLIYEYDFGDGWRHEVLLEKVLPKEPGCKYPICVTGKRACPPEDIGGIPGFYRFLKVRLDPQHEMYQYYGDWCTTFDPDAFDPKESTSAMHGYAVDDEG